MLRLENKAIFKNERLRILRSIFLQPITYYEIDSSTISQQVNFSKVIYTTTKEYILNSHWLRIKNDRFIICLFWDNFLRSTGRHHFRQCRNRNTLTTKNLKEIFRRLEKQDMGKLLLVNE